PRGSVRGPRCAARSGGAGGVRDLRRAATPVLQPRGDARACRDCSAMNMSTIVPPPPPPLPATTRSYVVVHETSYTYDQPVGLSRQIVHLSPRALPWQTCRAHTLKVTPEPEILTVGEDPFGNPMTSFCIDDDHESLMVHAESLVDVKARV